MVDDANETAEVAGEIDLDEICILFAQHILDNVLKESDGKTEFKDWLENGDFGDIRAEYVACVTAIEGKDRSEIDVLLTCFHEVYDDLFDKPEDYVEFEEKADD